MTISRKLISANDIEEFLQQLALEFPIMHSIDHFKKMIPYFFQNSVTIDEFFYFKTLLKLALKENLVAGIDFVIYDFFETMTNNPSQAPLISEINSNLNALIFYENRQRQKKYSTHLFHDPEEKMKLMLKKEIFQIGQDYIHSLKSLLSYPKSYINEFCILAAIQLLSETWQWRLSTIKQHPTYDLLKSLNSNLDKTKKMVDISKHVFNARIIYTQTKLTNKKIFSKESIGERKDTLLKLLENVLIEGLHTSPMILEPDLFSSLIIYKLLMIKDELNNHRFSKSHLTDVIDNLIMLLQSDQMKMLKKR